MSIGVIVGLVAGVALVAACVIAVLVRRRPASWSVRSAPERALTCPSCAKRFERPDIMIITEADVRKYGRDPVQCPRCSHIWDAGGRPPTIGGEA